MRKTDDSSATSTIDDAERGRSDEERGEEDGEGGWHV